MKRSMKPIITYLLLLAYVICSGDNSRDSLLLEIAKNDSDSNKVNNLLLLANDYYYSDPSFAERTYRSALFLSRKLDYDYGIANAQYALGRFYSESEFDLSAECIFKAILFFETKNDSNKLADCYNILGIIKSKINDFDQSLQNFFYAEKIYKKLNDTSSLVKVNNNIGLIYSQLGKDSLALNSFETAERLNNKANGNNTKLVILYGNIGEIYLKKSELSVAEEYYHKALLIIDTTVNIGAKAWILAKMGNLKLNKKEYDSCYFYTTGSIELSRKIGRLSDLHEAYGIMTSYYEQTKDYEKAFQYLEKRNAIQDSLFDEDQVKRMAMQEMRFQFEKEKDLQYLKYQAEKLRLWTVILSLIILVILAVSILIILRSRQKKIRAQNEKLNIEKKQLEELMQMKSRELTSQLLQLANNNELNHQLINKLRKAKINFKRENHALIDGIITDLRINVNDSMWKPFERSFSEIHPNFFNKLRLEFPNITQKEQRLAAFLFLNLTSKEIAALTHISVSGVEMARIRLRKKLGISGTETNFSVFLAKYF